MATRKTRGRKAPKRKNGRFLVHGKWTSIQYFDGYRLRHSQPDHVDIIHWRGDGGRLSSSWEPATLHIDEVHVNETVFFVRVHEIMTMRRWTTRGDNKRLPPYQKMRAYLKQQLCLPPPVPEFVVRREWDDEHQLHIWYVDGKIVRQYLDPHFTHGGHDLVYPSYITAPRTVWLDVHQRDEELRYSRIHEVVERQKMEKGWSYNRAHAYAIQAELRLRLKEYHVKPTKPKHAPLGVAPISQEGDATCGPASLKMLLDHDGHRNPQTGQPYTEAELVALCECDPDLGTDHAPLVRALEKIVGKDGFTCGQGGDIRLLRHLVCDKRRPVLVGWWNGRHRTSEEVREDADSDEGHFGVVKQLTSDLITLADPWIIDPKDDTRSGPGDTTLKIRTFRSRWYDMDGTPSETDPGFHIVRGWYLYLHAPASKAKNDPPAA